jgi:universal stress protein A
MKSYKHILLPVDFSEPSDVIDNAATLAGHYQARLTLLHVIEHFPEDLPIDWIGPENVDPQSYLVRVAREKLRRIVERVEYPNVNHEIVVSNFSAVHEIIQFAEKHSIDLVVINSKSKSAASRILGSTTFSVVQHASCDVLVYRRK